MVDNVFAMFLGQYCNVGVGVSALRNEEVWVCRSYPLEFPCEGYMYIHISIYTHVYTCICIVYVYIYIYIYLFIFIYLFTHIIYSPGLYNLNAARCKALGFSPQTLNSLVAEWLQASGCKVQGSAC